MPWCPKCKLEYRDEFKVCNDCEVELVEELEPEKEETAKQEVIYDKEAFLTTASDDIEAKMIEDLLEPEGIPVLKKTREVDSFLLGGVHFGVDLFVPSEALEKAKEIIENCPEEISEEELESQAEQYEAEEEEYKEENQESNDRADEEENGTTSINYRWMIAFAFLLIAAVYIIVHLCKGGF